MADMTHKSFLENTRNQSSREDTGLLLESRSMSTCENCARMIPRSRTESLGFVRRLAAPLTTATWYSTCETDTFDELKITVLYCPCSPGSCIDAVAAPCALDSKGTRRERSAQYHGVCQRWGVRPDDGFLRVSNGLHWSSLPAPCLPKRMLGAGYVRHPWPGTK